MPVEKSIPLEDFVSLRNFLRDCLYQLLDDKGKSWLEKQLKKIVDQEGGRSLQLAFGMAPRFIRKEPFALSGAQLEEAQRFVPGIRPDSWTLLTAARVLCLLHAPFEENTFVAQVENLFDTADEGEATALYAGIPLYPFPKAFVARASEGVRTNMTSVFDAIVLRNPFPAQYFEENAWNQMFLKAIFTNRPIYRIQRIADRANPALARIISDYAHERWAASREVTPEIWRPIGAFLSLDLLPDIQNLFTLEDSLQQQAAALVCSESSLPEAQALLAEHPTWASWTKGAEANWDNIGKAWEQRQS